MKSDFVLAITQLAAEKNLPRETILSAVEAALVSAYRRDSFAPNQNISVKINPNTGRVEVWVEKTVVKKPADTRLEVSVEEARRFNSDAELDDILMVESTPYNAGRIAAQTAKQVILQRLHEAEHSAILEEYAEKEDEVVTGLIQRIEPGQINVDLGRTEAILPASEQVRTERYRVGQRLKVCILQVLKTTRGPRVLVSRAHPDLLRRLLELEVPEVYNGSVEIKSIAREAGYRSKVAVAARQKGIDPVGCCVGLRGIRIQNIVNELNGEKIDVIQWNPDVAAFVTNALSPAQIVGVNLNEEENIATVVVPDRQLSLAIGKEGQNARLAAKLTGWRIDIKSASIAEAEKAAAKPAPEVEEEEVVTAEEPAAEMPEILEPTPASAEPVEGVATEQAEPLPLAAGVPAEPLVSFEPKVTEEKAELRFAEDILGPKPDKPEDKAKKKKRKGAAKEGAEDGIRIKKRRRDTDLLDEDEEL
ncbi:MAG: transcription termination/antitermination protein NusA [Dehalococcoidia bacterium]|nr:transcription termination/antitermination protein NusA [Dehalococcoidia bacterium]